MLFADILTPSELQVGSKVYQVSLTSTLCSYFVLLEVHVAIPKSVESKVGGYAIN